MDKRIRSVASIAFPIKSRLKLSFGACILSLGVTNPSINESKFVTFFKSAIIGILPPSRRYKGDLQNISNIALFASRNALINALD